MKVATSSAAAAIPDAASEGLVRAIGRWAMVALVINNIVGSGIFSLPARVHALAGGYGLWAYAVCGAVMGCIAFCLSEVASRFAATGGPYLYTREAFGPLPGFLVGWMMVLTRMTSAAIIANIFADYLAYFWPVASGGPIHTAVMVVALIALAVINVLGVRQGAGLLVVLAIAKLIPMVLFVAVGLFFVDPQRFAGAAPPQAAAFTQSVLLLIFAFGGSETAMVTAGEMKEPHRDAPFALLVGVGATTLLYVLIQTVCIGTLPELADSKRPLADAAARFAGGVGGAVITVGAVLSTFGALGGTTLAAPRLLFAMAEHGQLPVGLSRPHPRFRTPHVGIVVVTTGAVVLAWSGTVSYLLTLNVVTRLLQYLACALAVFALRRRDPEAPAPFTLRGAGLIVPVTAIACVWLIARSSAKELRDAGIALALGLLFYALRATRRRNLRRP